MIREMRGLEDAMCPASKKSVQDTNAAALASAGCDRPLAGSRQLAPADQYPILPLAFVPDGRSLAYGSWDTCQSLQC